MTYSDKDVHERIMREVLNVINACADAPFVLKGGTALFLCYGLDRFSEDIDLDAEPLDVNHSLLAAALAEYCSRSGYELIPRKDSETTQRYMLHYDGENYLKVEASYRIRKLDPASITSVNGIKVYTIDHLCELKCGAYAHRDKLRDLYDVTYICTMFHDRLGHAARSALSNALIYKGLDQFDYLVATQSDPMIDVGLLETRFLESYEIMGVLREEQAWRPSEGAPEEPPEPPKQNPVGEQAPRTAARPHRL